MYRTDPSALCAACCSPLEPLRSVLALDATHLDPFIDRPYLQIPPFRPPSPSAPPFSASGSSEGDGSDHSRWSFLNSPELDLTLSVASEGEAERAALAPPEQQEGASWSLVAETVPPGADEVEVQETPTTPLEDEEGNDEVAQREMKQNEAVSPPIQQQSTSDLLRPPLEHLNRSTGSAPDSFVDPFMAPPSSADPEPAPPALALAPPSSFSLHSTPPRPPFPPSTSTPQHFAPPAPFGATPSPPRIDLAGRALPSAPPGTDPFAFALAHQPPPSPRSSPSKSLRGLGSLKNLAAMPFRHLHPHPHGPCEDLTSSSFATTTSEVTSSSGGGGYWDTSLGLSGFLPSSPERGGSSAATTPPRPGPSPLGSNRRSQTEPLPLPPLPASLAPASPPPAAAGPSHPSLAVRRSIARPPSAIVLPSPHLPPSPPAVTGTTATSGTTGSSPSIPIISRTKSGFYRLPADSPALSPSYPLPPPTAKTPTSTSSRRSGHSLLPPPPPSSGAPSIASSFPSVPLSSSAPELSFPLPPPSPSAVVSTSGYSPASTVDPHNPFSTRSRQATGESALSGVSSSAYDPPGTVQIAVAQRVVPGVARPPSSLVELFTPTTGGGRAGARNPFGDHEEEYGDAYAGMSYPPSAGVGGGWGHRAGMESISSSVFAGMPGLGAALDSPVRAVRNRVPSAVPEEKSRGEDEEQDKEAEKKRRTEAWLSTVVAPTPPASASFVESSAASSIGGTGGWDGAETIKSSSATAGGSTLSPRRPRWAAKSGVGWSLAGERERWRTGSIRSRSTKSGKSSRMGKGKGKKGTLAGWWTSQSRPVQIGLLAGAVALLLVLVGVAVGLSRRSTSAAVSAADCSCLNGGSASYSAADGGTCSCACKDSWGGTSCAFNATCVVVAQAAGGTSRIAQGLLEIADTANGMWEPKVNTSRLGTVLERYILPSSSSSSSASSSSSSSCAAQLSLLLLPNLPSSKYPSRLSWSTAALLSTLSLTESNSSLWSLRTFASGLSFAQFGDSAASKPNSNYQTIVGGYTFDFATMQRSAAGGEWEKTLSPSADAVDAVAGAGDAAQALDTVTNNAVTASKQRTLALQHYWNDTLGLSSSDLATFRSAVQGAEVVIPLDATASVGGAQLMDVASVATGNGSSFPPAVGCWPGLASAVVDKVNGVEESAFGLESVASGQAGNVTCTNRPIYGILNLLHLRLPFPSSDSRSSLPQQSLVLRSPSTSSSLSSRLTLHAGELLSAGALVSSYPSSPSAATSIEHFGLLSSAVSAIDHILLDYLSLLSISIAQALVAYVLSGSSAPPSAASTDAAGKALWAASEQLAGLPVMEVQLWGGLAASEIDFARSGLSYPPSSSSSSSAPSTLFFGSTPGGSFRTWASSAGLSRVEWALSAEEVEVATDDAGSEVAFDKVWSSPGKTAQRVWAQLGAANLTG
ncbi:hypothetical protein JCM8097_005714 [Rhodosporidiobolus ruineniae]